MNRLLFFILFAANVAYAMEERLFLWQKYKIERDHSKVKEEEIELSAQIFAAQASFNITLFILRGALPTVAKSTETGFNDHWVLRANNQNANRDRFENGYFYVPINMFCTSLNWAFSVPDSSDYLANAYENRNNLTKCAGNAFMGTGLATNSLLISAGGANNLTSNQSVKNTLYGVSMAGTAIEAFKHAKQAYNLWNKDRSQAWEHVRYAGLFAAFGVMPFALDSYQKKVTQ